MQHIGSATCTNGGDIYHNDAGNPIISYTKFLACKTVATTWTGNHIIPPPLIPRLRTRFNHLDVPR